ncbi:MAG: lysophospholipid acyltransferase family protein [bacterium]
MIVRESFSRDVARLVIWYPVRLIIKFLPVTFSFSLFRLLGRLHFYLGTRSTENLRKNILLGHPAIDRKTTNAILKSYLENHYIDRLHIFTYPRLKSKKEMNKICSIEGLDLLASALNERKGVIIVLGHYGPIQLPLFQLGSLGYPIIQVGLPTDDGLSWTGRNVAFKLRMRYESMIPAKILPADTFLRPLFSHLKENGIVMMNIDPAGGGRWIGRLLWRPFFNHCIPFSLGSATLAHKTGAPLLPLSIKRLPDKTYRFEFDEVIRPEESQTPEMTLDRLIKWYERVVSEDPGLWHFWDEYEIGKMIRDKE